MSTTSITPLRRLRNELAAMHDTKLTATTMAKLLKCSESLVRNVEGGTTPLSEKLARQVSKLTGASPDWLMGDPVTPFAEVELAAGESELKHPNGGLHPNNGARELAVMGRVFHLLISCPAKDLPKRIARLERWVETEDELF